MSIYVIKVGSQSMHMILLHSHCLPHDLPVSWKGALQDLLTSASLIVLAHLWYIVGLLVVRSVLSEGVKLKARLISVGNSPRVVVSAQYDCPWQWKLISVTTNYSGQSSEIRVADRRMGLSLYSATKPMGDHTAVKTRSCSLLNLNRNTRIYQAMMLTLFVFFYRVSKTFQ